MLRKNEGPLDRTIRIVLGIVLLSAGLFALDGLQGSGVGIVAAAFGGWLILTGAIGFCPLYVPFAFSTTPEGSVRYGRGASAH